MFYFKKAMLTNTFQWKYTDILRIKRKYEYIAVTLIERNNLYDFKKILFTKYMNVNTSKIDYNKLSTQS